MKILHTADWHIGKKYNNTDFLPDFEFFAEQLIDIINTEKIDLLLVSGDVFDVYSPASSAQRLYFELLAKLTNIKTLKHIVITAGNHDSIAFLEAPKALLKDCHVEIVGEALDPEKCWMTFESDGEKVNIAPIPFLRNSDFPALDENANFDDFRQRNAQGLINYYRLVHEHKPAEGINIAMGHFTCIKDYTIDSERDITIGNIDSTATDQLPLFDYLAMGHIHKPMTASKSRNIHYSGSPYPMSFSERSDQKRVNIITSNNIEPVFIPLKSYRSFEQIKADDIKSIQQQLDAYKTDFQAVQIELILSGDGATAEMHKDLSDLQIEYNDRFLDRNICIEKVSVKRIDRNSTENRKPTFNTKFQTPLELLDSLLANEAEEYLGKENDMRNALIEILDQKPQ
jgi:exonuclease SbcD